jgi:hypothetical protein
MDFTLSSGRCQGPWQRNNGNGGQSSCKLYRSYEIKLLCSPSFADSIYGSAVLMAVCMHHIKEVETSHLSDCTRDVFNCYDFEARISSSYSLVCSTG